MEEQNWANEWAGLEPEQPRSGQCGCWLGAFALLMLLFGTCLGTAYFAWQQLDLPLNPGSVLAPPTVPPLVSPPSIDGDLIPGTPESEPAGTRPPLVATVTLASSGPQLEAASQASDIEARSLASSPRIDGDLAEWQDTPVYESAYRVFNDQGWDGSDDVRAYWRLGWDGSNLYVGVQVEDDVHVQTERGSTVFKGDGVSLQIDTALDADYGSRLSEDDFQINLSPGDFAGNPPDAYRFRGDNGGELRDMVGHGIQVISQPTGNGYILEAAVPWSDLGVTPAVGLKMGLALNVNDNDIPGTAVQEVMKSHIASRQFNDPSSWGTIQLR